MTITTEEAERLARFHDVSKELYSGNPEDSGLCAMHHTSAAALRSLAAERDALKNRIAQLEAAVEDMAKHVWRGDWDKLKPETRALLDEGK